MTNYRTALRRQLNVTRQRQVTTIIHLSQLRSTDTFGSHGPLISAEKMELWSGVWVAWSSKVGERWHVMLRRYDGDRWDKCQRISSAKNDAIFPAIVLGHNENPLVAWSDFINGVFRIRATRLIGRKPTTFDISDGVKTLVLLVRRSGRYIACSAR